jgi:DUF4097 and DUF4098 domain-containing protein YvlB
MLAEILLSMTAVAATDQTVNVTKGTKLSVNNFAGDVIIKTWDKDAVRVQVNHSDRETVDIRQVDQTLAVRSRSTRGGPSRSLDYNISVPSWMSVGVNGTYADVTAEGIGGDVIVETTHGDITVRGGSGFVSLKSVQGEITVEKAKGRVEVRAVNEGIRLADISGDLSAESTNGSIILDRIDSANVDLYTVNGNISYDGPIKDKGLYRLTTHNGMIAMPLAERSNVTLSARTYNGGIRSTFTLPTDSGSERRGKRLTMTLGNGSARVELESFGGTIALRRPGEARPETERRRRDRGDQDPDEKAKPKAKDLIGLADVVDAAIAEATAALPDAMAEAHAAIPEAMVAAQAAIPEALAEAQAAIPAAIAEAQAAMPEALAAAQASIAEAVEEALATVPWVEIDPRPNPHPTPNPRRR